MLLEQNLPLLSYRRRVWLVFSMNIFLNITYRVPPESAAAAAAAPVFVVGFFSANHQYLFTIIHLLSVPHGFVAPVHRIGK